MLKHRQKVHLVVFGMEKWWLEAKCVKVHIAKYRTD